MSYCSISSSNKQLTILPLLSLPKVLFSPNLLKARLQCLPGSHREVFPLDQAMVIHPLGLTSINSVVVLLNTTEAMAEAMKETLHKATFNSVITIPETQHYKITREITPFPDRLLKVSCSNRTNFIMVYKYLARYEIGRAHV